MSEEGQRPEPPLSRARAAVRRGDWDEAFEAFSAADQGTGLGADDLDSWATACYLLGKVDEALDALTRAYRICLDGERAERAAIIGFWVVFLLLEREEVSRAGGWMSRCAQLLDSLPTDSVAHGYMLALRAYQQVAVEGDYSEGEATAQRAFEIGRRAGDRDIEALALNLRGRSLIRSGRVDDGLPLLDEAMLDVTSGLLSPVVAGTVYCSLIEACEEVAELRRAHEWTHALTRWCDRQHGEVPFTAQCRVHRSKILQRNGALEEAEQEARQAYESYTTTPYERATGRALYQLAEVQRLRGQLAAAEDSYQRAHEQGVDPQPGLALLRLAEGNASSAGAALRRLLGEMDEPLERIKHLPAFVEVMVATQDLEAARAAAKELAEHASVFGTDALKAESAHASGAVRLAAGDAESAIVELRTAVETWQSLKAPYETARARIAIARACRMLGDEDTAALEERAARRQLDELGVAGDPPSGGSEPDHDLTERELEVLRLLATGVTNQAIAEDLYLSVRTVDRHVGNILTKLGLPSRTAAVSYAYEHDLVRPSPDG